MRKDLRREAMNEFFTAKIVPWPPPPAPPFAILVLRFSAAPKGPKQASPGGGNPACGVGPGDLIRMKIRPALKGRNKILDHKPVLPLQGVAILNTRSDSQGGALGWHVAAPTGRDSRSATSKLRKGGKTEQRNRDERAACSRPTFHRASLPLRAAAGPLEQALVIDV
jgi:hypothetical protein